MISFGTWVTRVWGLVLIVVGGWLFAQVGLGLDVPALDWNLAWPLALIVLGAVIVLGAFARRTR